MYYMLMQFKTCIILKTIILQTIVFILKIIKNYNFNFNINRKFCMN